MRTLRYGFWAALFVASACAPVTRGQQQDQNQQQNQGQSSTPIPAYKSPLGSTGDNNDTEAGSQQAKPDTASPSGFQDFSLGMTNERTYWQPHAELFVTGDSNGLESPNGTSWGTRALLGGGVDLHRISGDSFLTLSYQGGGMFSNQRYGGNQTFQSLSFVDRYAFHRVVFTVLDDFTYLPQDAFGFAGVGGALIPGATGAGGLGSVFTSGQSLIIGQGQSVGNASDGEAEVFLTPRSSLTFVGGYSFLHYFSGDLLDYNGAIFRGGYNYKITRNDSIAAFYQYRRINYSNANQSITAQSGQLLYGRRVTGRLAFQISGGPEIIESNIAITGIPAANPFPSTGSVTEIGWTLHTNVNWQLERGSLGAQYFHGVSGGSGVLGGAIDDTFEGSINRRLSRTFSGTLTGGYTRVRGVPISALVGGGSPNQRYDYVFGGANLSHPISRTLALRLSYQIEYQTSNGAVCNRTICGTDIIAHLVSLGVTWRERPLLF